MNVAERFFVDTNVILYLTDATDPVRQSRAADWLNYLWEQGKGSLSWQVLHEFYSNAVRKLGVAREEARFLVGTFLEWRPVDSSPDLLHRAWYWTDTAQISYWDALILASAEVADCKYLLSEDFQAGRRFGSIQVVNPFLSPPASTFPPSR